MKTKFEESFDNLQTVKSHINNGNQYATEKLAEIIDGVNILCKQKLWYSNPTWTKEDRDLALSNLKTDKLKLISLIANL